MLAKVMDVREWRYYDMYRIPGVVLANCDTTAVRADRLRTKTRSDVGGLVEALERDQT